MLSENRLLLLVLVPLLPKADSGKRIDEVMGCVGLLFSFLGWCTVDDASLSSNFTSASELVGDGELGTKGPKVLASVSSLTIVLGAGGWNGLTGLTGFACIALVLEVSSPKV